MKFGSYMTSNTREEVILKHAYILGQMQYETEKTGRSPITLADSGYSFKQAWVDDVKNELKSWGGNW